MTHPTQSAVDVGAIYAAASGHPQPTPVQRAFTAMAEADATKYVRARDLHRVSCPLPGDAEDYSVRGTQRIIALLKAQLNSYRLLGMRDHWSYDASHHVALAAALKGEEAMLAHLLNVQGLERIMEEAK